MKSQCPKPQNWDLEFGILFVIGAWDLGIKLFMANKKELYKRIKIAGMISYIPVVLAAPALAGFFLGDYLQKRFNLPFYFSIIFITLGFIIGIRESVRIIRTVLKIEKSK